MQSVNYRQLIENKTPVIVSWLDHSTFEDTGWADEETLKQILGGIKIKTIGFVLLEDEDSIVMASTIGEHEKFAHEFCILKGVITNVEILAYGDKRYNGKSFSDRVELRDFQDEVSPPGC